VVAIMWTQVSLLLKNTCIVCKLGTYVMSSYCKKALAHNFIATYMHSTGTF
jgi:hypothetical protein